MMKKHLLILLFITTLFAGRVSMIRAQDNAITGSRISNPAQVAFETKAVNTRYILSNLFKEHTILASSYLTGLYDGKEISRYQELINVNSNAILDIVGNLYGANARTQVAALWQQHLDEYWNYTMARKANDTGRMDATRQSLSDISDRLGSTFDQVSTNLAARAVSGHMQAHIDGTLGIVDAHAAGNEAEKANLMKTGYDQAGMFADDMVKALIADRPNQF